MTGRKNRKVLILLLILLNIFLFYLMRPSLKIRADKLEEENNELNKEIEALKSIDEDKDLDGQLYKSDLEFYHEMDAVFLKNEIEDYTSNIISSASLDDHIESEVEISFISDLDSLITILDEIERLPALSIRNISTSIEGKNLKSSIYLAFKSDFTDIFRAEKDLVNKNPFKEKAEKENLDLKETVSFENEENKKDEVELSELKDKLDLEDRITSEESEYVEKVVYKDRPVKEVRKEFIEVETDKYFIREKMDQNLYLYSFNNINPRDKKIYLLKNIRLKEAIPSILSFNLNSNIEGLKIGMEAMEDPEREPEIVEYRSDSWQNIIFKIDDGGIDSLNLFLVNDNLKKGSVILEGLEIRGREDE